MTIFRNHAKTYASLGWQIFPLAVGTKIPRKGSHGLLDATTEPSKIQEWIRECPDANIALRCGPESNVVVLDFDPRSGCVETVNKLNAQGKKFPSTVMSETPRKGRHLYYAYDRRVNVSKSNALGPGIDVKTTGGQIVLPPSWWGEMKAAYKWVRGPKGPDLPKLPDWIITALAPKPVQKVVMRPIHLTSAIGYRRQALADLHDVTSRMAALDDGRHDAPWRAAARLGKYVHHGMLSESVLSEAIVNACTANGFLAKYSRFDVETKIARGIHASRSDPLPPLAREHRPPGENS